jgi:NhaA family Na+:H+ antiporter
MLDLSYHSVMIARLYKPFETFFKQEAAGGIILLIAAAIAIIWANSGLSSSYFDLWNTYVRVGAGGFEIHKPLLLWINDGLMAIFFFVVGLEIKREVLTGELSSPKKASLALAGAIGGMVIPATLYALFNFGLETSAGWGIPMATDIAFALGVLALMGDRVPIALKVFLTALAIADDLGAVLVIALFYTAELSILSLVVGFAVLGLLLVLNRMGVTRTAVYVILGIVLWVAFLKSGVHATIAGVLLALTIPARRTIDTPDFKSKVGELLGILDSQPEQRQQAVHSIEIASIRAESPLIRMEHSLHGWVAFFIMPVFALANAGVALNVDAMSAFGEPVVLGVLVGLLIGKQLGVSLFAWIAVKTKIAELPDGVSWGQIYGVSILTGIGFTMSLFIANLAFEGSAQFLDQAKIGILAASLLAGLAGWFVLGRQSRTAES